jgi:hypothetical protein
MQRKIEFAEFPRRHRVTEKKKKKKKQKKKKKEKRFSLCNSVSSVVNGFDIHENRIEFTTEAQSHREKKRKRNRKTKKKGFLCVTLCPLW